MSENIHFASPSAMSTFTVEALMRSESVKQFTSKNPFPSEMKKNQCNAISIEQDSILTARAHALCVYAEAMMASCVQGFFNTEFCFRCSLVPHHLVYSPKKFICIRPLTFIHTYVVHKSTYKQFAISFIPFFVVVSVWKIFFGGWFHLQHGRLSYRH